MQFPKIRVPTGTQTNMLRQTLSELFTRDLNALKDEIGKYENEADMWKIAGGVTNSAGNLCLHLIGNINHFFGALIAKNGFVRDRDAEFTSKNVPREQMSESIDRAIEVLREAIDGLSDADLETNFAVQHRDRNVSTLQMLLHLSTHLNYHLGQINYHRRLLG